jgi:hypothetical protein
MEHASEQIFSSVQNNLILPRAKDDRSWMPDYLESYGDKTKGGRPFLAAAHSLAAQQILLPHRAGGSPTDLLAGRGGEQISETRYFPAPATCQRTTCKSAGT